MMRDKMVREQIQNRGIHDPNVLRAMLDIPREKFVPREMQRFAYEDGPVNLGRDLTTPQPYIVAYMTEILGPGENDRILEIGTGLGYHTAILSYIASEVYSIEILKGMAEKSARVLDQMGFNNASVKAGDGYDGWSEFAPYDAILMTTAPAREIPPPLVDQLRDGGIIVAPIGEHRQKLVVLQKDNGHLLKRVLLSVRFDSMIGKAERFRSSYGPSGNRGGNGPDYSRIFKY